MNINDKDKNTTFLQCNVLLAASKMVRRKCDDRF